MIHPPNPMIQLYQLSKTYKDADFYALNNLNLQINTGEIFGLLGPNGAGKTTLISMLCGLLQPTSGSVSIKGLNYAAHRKQLQQLIGIVPQEYALYPTLTAYENLVYFGSMYGLRGKELMTKVKNALTDLGLERFIHKKINTFSGGMKRRVNLIAGILHQPELLILDEPTVGVDVQSKNVIIAHLKAINKNGTTIIYTSHHINEAQDFCTDVAIIDHGELVVKGNPTDLVQQTEQANNLEEVFINLTGKVLRDYV